MQPLAETLLNEPVIAAVKTDEALTAALASPCSAVFLLASTLLTVDGLVRRIHEAGKLAVVHIDLVDGLSSREIAVDSLIALCSPDGIISTRPTLIRRARHRGLLTVQRAFILDSLSLTSLSGQLEQGKPDFVEILPGIMAGITPEYIFWAIITGLGITLLVVFGIKAIANFATVFVPLFVIVVIVAAAIILQNHSLTELLTTAPPGPALSLGAATTMVAGGFIAGAICTPDYARFLKNGTQVFWMTLIGTFVGELGMNLLAVLLAHAMGTENIVDIMMGTSGIIGVIIVVASTVKLNDINLYSSSLGLATMINALFNKAISRNGLVWALGIVGTLLSVIGIINYFTNFLTLLGVAIPPVAGIMVVDYFILKRSRATLDASRAKGELPEKVEKWNPIAIVCWIAGFAVGEVTSIMNVGIPGLNSLILAGVLYWIVMKVYASMKKVDTVTFTETDQVL